MSIREKVDNTQDGICSGCGNCCANILLLSDVEIKNIKKYILKYNIKAVNRNTIFNCVNVCPFLSKENTCNIYSVRPDICKKFSCNPTINKDLLNYTNVKAINMFKEFYPTEFFEDVDLTNVNSRIDELQKKIKGR